MSQKKLLAVVLSITTLSTFALAWTTFQVDREAKALTSENDALRVEVNTLISRDASRLLELRNSQRDVSLLTDQAHRLALEAETSTEDRDAMALKVSGLEATNVHLRDKLAEVEDKLEQLAWSEELPALIEELEERQAEVQEQLDILTRNLPMEGRYTYKSDWGDYLCTGSMKPQISCYDRVRVFENPPLDKLREGMVIGFVVDASCFGDPAGENAYVDHRIVGIGYSDGNYHFTTKGDANEGVDWCRVPGKQVQHVVTGIEKEYYGWRR